MEATNIPDGLPTLSRGRHAPGAGEACVMEYVSLLAGEAWSDHPACTNWVLAQAARTVNDCLDDRDRHLLVPLIGRLLGTTADIDPTLLTRPYVFMLLPHHSPKSKLTALSALIDEYDRLTGRTEHRELTDTDLRELASAVAK